MHYNRQDSTISGLGLGQILNSAKPYGSPQKHKESKSPDLSYFSPKKGKNPDSPVLQIKSTTKVVYEEAEIKGPSSSTNDKSNPSPNNEVI